MKWADINVRGTIIIIYCFPEIFRAVYFIYFNKPHVLIQHGAVSVAARLSDVYSCSLLQPLSLLQVTGAAGFGLNNNIMLIIQSQSGLVHSGP